MKLSIVIICWNDLKLIGDCLASIYRTTRATRFEVIVSDNGSTDGSIKFIRQHYPTVRILENGTNLGFSKGNNRGIQASEGEYVLILNPDTIIHGGTLDKWIQFADRHPEAGAFGCRILNPDGSLQYPARPFPTIWRYWLAALHLRHLAYLSRVFVSDAYTGWKGDTERTIDQQQGCCILFRADLLRRLGGFDEQFNYHFEETDLCYRVWQAGYSVLYTPEVSITHLGGQSSAVRFPMWFQLESYRNRYRYFYKYFGRKGVHRCRRVTLAFLRVRQLQYGLVRLIRPTEALKNQMLIFRVSVAWNRHLDPVRLVEAGDEPDVEALQNGHPWKKEIIALLKNPVKSAN
jgi:GT2 family glycosyltransferase